MYTTHEAFTTPAFTRAEYAVLQKSNKIHDLLSNLVLRGCGLNDYAKKLAKILQRSITIEDLGGHVLASGQYGTVDQAQEDLLSLGWRSDEVVQYFFETGIYDHFSHKMEPVHVPPIPEWHMEMERITVPIIVDRKIHGYIWIVSGECPFTELDKLAIAHAATMAALIMFKEQAQREAKEAHRGDFFEQLLKGPPYTVVLLEQARQLGYRFKESHQVLFLSGQAVARGNSHSLGTRLSCSRLTVRRWLNSQGYHALIVWCYEGLVLIIESDKLSVGKEIAYSMIAALSHPDKRLLIGLGGVSGSESTGIKRSYSQAREAATIATRLGLLEGVIVFEELGILHWLYHLSPEEQAQNRYIKKIEILANYDATRQTDLVKTLERYLDNGCLLRGTASLLDIHYNTLLHRLQRIEQLCELRIKDSPHRFNLHAAIKSYILHKNVSR